MHMNSSKSESTRRKFFKDTGKRALWAAPTLTVLMSASKLSAWGTKGSPTREHTYSYSDKLKKIIQYFINKKNGD